VSLLCGKATEPPVGGNTGQHNPSKPTETKTSSISSRPLESNQAEAGRNQSAFLAMKGSRFESVRRLHRSTCKAPLLAGFRDLLDAIYASQRLRLPFEGVLLVGY